MEDFIKTIVIALCFVPITFSMKRDEEKKKPRKPMTLKRFKGSRDMRKLLKETIVEKQKIEEELKFLKFENTKK
jgi:hypothetical protein